MILVETYLLKQGEHRGSVRTVMVGTLVWQRLQRLLSTAMLSRRVLGGPVMSLTRRPSRLADMYT